MTARTLSPDAALVPGSREHPAGCGACGGAVLVVDARRGGPCPLCGAAGLRPQPALATVLPEALVPFAVERADLERHLRAHLRGAWFRVADLEVPRLVERATPVWLPAWWVDATGRGSFETEVAFRYAVRSSVDRYTGGAWKSETVEEERLRWEPRVGTIDRRVDNAEVDGRRDAAWFREHLGPYDRADAVPASPERVDRAAVVLPDRATDEAEPEALGIVRARLAEEVRRAADGVAIRSFALDVAPADLHWSWLLLPAWSTWYDDDRGGRHVLWVHGRTGRVAGPRLVSEAKWVGCAVAILGAAVVAGVVAAVATVLFFWFPPILIGGLVAMGLAFLLGLCALWPLTEAWGRNRREGASARPR